MEFLKRTWQYFKPYKIPIIVGLICGYAVIILNMVNPYINKIIFDRVFKGGEASLLIPVLCVMVLLTVLKHCFQYTKAYLIESRSMLVINSLRNHLMKKFLSLSYETYNTEKTGHLMQIMTNDAENLKNFCANTIPAMIESVFSFLFASIVLMTLSVRLAVITFLVLPLVYLLSRKYSKDLHPIFREIRYQTSQVSTVVQENINGVRIVRAFASEKFEEQKLDVENSKFKFLHFHMIVAWAKNFWKMQVVANLPNIILMSYGAYLTMTDNISLGTFVAFSGYITNIMNPINLLPTYISSIQNAVVSGEKVYNFIDIEPRISNRLEAQPVKQFYGNIEFHDVCVSHDGVPVLKHINLSIPLGKKVGILGATSSGKTTLVNLIGRYIDPNQGSITLDGVDLRDYEIRSLREHISYALQDVFLFSDTVDSNIAFCNPALSFETVESCAKAADADSFIQNLSEGYETIVGERGIGLSGGQKQRISIARALAKPSEIIVLDDSTSALDMETERELLKSLKSFTADKTQIIIAHRISSVKDADEIILLDEGTIAERGKHEELLELNGKYREIFDNQYKDFFAEQARLQEV